MQNEVIFTTKSEFVFNTIKNRILENTLEPGTELIISRISEELNVSIIPVREALKALESEGLIEMEAHKSARVAEFSVEKLRQIITIRAGLEGYASRLAVKYINDINMEKLEDILRDMKKAMESADSENFNLYNMKFHRYIYQIPPFPMLYDMIINVWDGGKWTRSVFAISPKRMKNSLNEHIQILDAIKEKNEDKVEKLVREHRMNAGLELETMSKLKHE